MNENYQFKDKQLIICDPDLGIHIQESFTPYLIPEDWSSTEGLVVKKDNTGKVLRAYYEEEGKLHGQYHLYYPGGKLETECFYFLGLLHGPSRFYSETGNCLSETWFYKNRKEGKSKRYYLSGQLCSIERFKNGVLHGKQEYYYEDGTLKSSLSYQRGRLEGKVILFWPNGKKKRECFFKEGFREEWDRMWNKEGKLLDEGSYKRGDPVGKHRRFYENGTLQEEREYHTPQCYDRVEWDLEGNKLLEGRFDAHLCYEETTWQGGVPRSRKGRWKEGRIQWREDVN